MGAGVGACTLGMWAQGFTLGCPLRPPINTKKGEAAPQALLHPIQKHFVGEGLLAHGASTHGQPQHPQSLQHHACAGKETAPTTKQGENKGTHHSSVSRMKAS